MTFWDHLEDLRKSIFRVLGMFAAVAVVLFFFKGFLFDDVVLAPADSDFILYRLAGADVSLSLVNLEVVAQFVIHMKVTFICALILILPYVIYEIWRFVLPALYENERKALRGAFAFGSVLFYIGIAVGYFIIFPTMLHFFAGYQVSDSVPNTFSLSSYISLLTSIVLLFGLMFEFPAVVAVISRSGLITCGTLRKYRRHAICAVVILAAVVTPTGDPFSLLIVSVPLYLLYEFSILICRRAEVDKQMITETYDIDK